MKWFNLTWTYHVAKWEKRNGEERQERCGQVKMGFQWRTVPPLNLGSERENYGVFSIVTIIGDHCWHLLVQSTTNVKSSSMYETRAPTLWYKDSKSVAICKPERGPLPENQTGRHRGLRLLDFQSCKKKKFLLFKPPRILLWELEQTNTETKAQRRQTLKLDREPSYVILPSCGRVDIFSVVFLSLLFYPPVLTL